MHARLARSLLLAVVLVVLLPAVASAKYGNGLVDSSDENATYAGFIIIALFPTLALILSVLQSRLERRKQARRAAAQARSARSEWRGGW